MRKFLLFPLRLCVGWGLSPRLLGLIGATMLVLLRVSIGWHFYMEGVDKRESGTWSAAPFFANAKGPFAKDFRSFVWDGDGEFRLNKDAVKLVLARYRDQVGIHYGFDDKQKAEAQNAYAAAIKQYEWVVAENSADLEEFELGRDYVADLDTKPSEKDVRDGVSSLGGQRDTMRREWQSKGAAALGQINTLWGNFESALNKIATPEQRAASGYLPFVKPRTNVIDTSVIDRLIPYFDIAVGLCLLFGFLTPVAALAAAGFLGSVFLSQLPPTGGPSSTYYQLVESMACLVLAGTGAGRFAGIDYFLHLIVRKVWGGELEEY